MSTKQFRWLGHWSRLPLLFLLLASSLWFATAVPTSNAAVAAPFVVNSTGDGPDSQVGDDICNDGNGYCTLRAAMMEANASSDISLIHFNIPGQGPHVIQPQTALPLLEKAVIIDGYTQPGSLPNTNPAPLGLNTRLLIVLDGSQASNAFGFSWGLDTTLDGLVIRGLVIHSFSEGAIGSYYQEMYDVTNARFVGNFIGTNASGTEARGSGSRILLAGGPRFKNIDIGGLNPEDRNLINGSVGIDSRYAEVVQIHGNLIGTDVTGQRALGNGYGVYVRDACPVLIGGIEEGATNVISGNRTHGIELEGNDGCTSIRYNLVGLAADGRTPLGNEGSGINAIEHAGVNIDGNRIAYNLGNGFSAGQNSNSNLFATTNSIFNNGGLGIDLNNDGVTPNDPLDGDSGPNGLQNYPVLESVTHTASNVYVTGLLNSLSDQRFVVMFFTNEQCDPSGYGEGESFVTQLNVKTDGDGNVYFTAVFPEQPERPFVTATASYNGASSEFSQCRADPLYLVTLLRANVQQLIDDGELANSAGTRLLAKLDNVEAALLMRHENTALIRLQDFISSVRNLMNRRQLPQQLGQPLIDAAWALIRQINLP